MSVSQAVTFLAAAALAPSQSPNDPLSRDRLDRNPPAPSVDRGTEVAEASVSATGADVPIRRIDFTGVAAPGAVAAAARQFIGRPATKETLDELAEALSTAYEQTDIALYTVAIREQDVSDGVVDVALVEGSIAEVQLRSSDPNARFPLLERRVASLVGQAPLSRRLFERQSALIQGIPGMEIEATFENPQGGDSVILAVVPKQKKIEGAFAINNRGPTLLGDTVLQAGLDIYGTAIDGDQIALSAYATPNLRNYRAFDGSYSVPLSASGLSLTTTFGKLWTRARKLDIRGKATFGGATLTYPLLRTATRAADVSIGIDGVDSDNALFGSVFSTEKTRALRAAGAFVAVIGKTNLQLSGSLSQGLDLLGSDVGDTGASAAFRKVNLAGNIEQSFSGKLVGRLSAVAQLSGSRVPASELLTFGGPAIGRAFDSGLLSGDRGAGGFVELAYRPIAAEAFKTSEIYAFADAATLKSRSRPMVAAASYDLASTGAGIRAKFRERMQFGVEYAAVLKRPAPSFSRDGRLSFFYAITF